MRANPWSKEEIDELYRLQRHGSVLAISKELRRPYNSVYNKMVHLGLHKPIDGQPKGDRPCWDPENESPFLNAISQRLRFAQEHEFYCDGCKKGFNVEPMKRRGKKLCAACYLDSNRFVRAAMQIYRPSEAGSL